MTKFKGGIESVVEMLNLLDTAARKKLLANVAARDPQLARKIEESLFSFEDLVHMASRELQELLRAIPDQTLVLALRKASEPLRDHIFKSMSSRSAQLLREELQNQPPQKVSDVEAAQHDIIEIAKRLEAIGRILLKKN